MPQSTLTVHGLNPIIKRPRLLDWIKKRNGPNFKMFIRNIVQILNLEQIKSKRVGMTSAKMAK